MSIKSKLDSYDLEFLKQELLGAVAESQATRVLQKLDELKEEMYLDRLELENDRVFGEPSGGGGGALPGPFDPVYGDELGVAGFTEGYVQVGGFTVWVPVGDGEDFIPNPASPGQKFVAVKFSVSSQDPAGAISAELAAYSDYASLRDAQQDLDYVVYPIYLLKWDEGDEEDEENGGEGEGEGEGEGDRKCTIAMDLRRMPTTGMLETFLEDEDEDEDDGSGSGEGGS